MKRFFILAVAVLLCGIGCLEKKENKETMEQQKSKGIPVVIAIWDFDGTIIDGDSSEGLVRQGKTMYAGLVADGIRAGFSPEYRGEEGVRRFFEAYNKKLESGDIAGAYRDVAAVFIGANASDLEDFCVQRFEEMQKFYYKGSVVKIRDLESKGVENHIISASLDIFVRATVKTLGVPASQIHGVKIEVKNGILTGKVLEPFPCEGGKIDIMRQIEAERNGKALYGFGNSYKSDAPFLLEIAKQGGTAVIFNGGFPRPGLSEHFICIDQTETFE